MAPALRAGGGELRGGWGRALHLPALPRVAVEGAAHDERARALQRRVPPPHQDAGAVAHRVRRALAPLRPPAQRAHHAPTTRRLARDPELGPNRQQGSVASSEENNDSSTVPDDALRSFPPLDRHRLLHLSVVRPVTRYELLGQAAQAAGVRCVWGTSTPSSCSIALWFCLGARS